MVNVHVQIIGDENSDIPELAIGMFIVSNRLLVSVSVLREQKHHNPLSHISYAVAVVPSNSLFLTFKSVNFNEEGPDQRGKS